MEDSRKIPVGKAKDLTNQKFGRLTALYRIRSERTKWHCICECGKETDVFATSLLSGHT